MKPFIDETIEQLKGPKKSPPLNDPGSTKNPLHPGEIFREALKQTLGFGGANKVPSKDQINQMNRSDHSQSQQQITDIKNQLAKESSGKKQIPKAVSKANLEILTGSTQVDNEPPQYVSGKTGYQSPKDAEKREKANKQQSMMSALPVVKSRTPRGSWMKGIERKKQGIEIKGGRE